jgi:hypothetical protein
MDLVIFSFILGFELECLNVGDLCNVCIYSWDIWIICIKKIESFGPVNVVELL